MTVQKETFLDHTHCWIVKSGDVVCGTFPTRKAARDFVRATKLREQPQYVLINQ